MNETFYSENDYRLYHYGRLGMHWGVRNGPPYPLDKAKRAEMKRNANLSDEEKRQAILKPDMKTIRKHSDEFSNKELQEAVTRLNLKAQVTKAAKGKSAYDRMDDTMKKVAKASGWVATGAAAWTVFTKLYNKANGAAILPGIANVIALTRYKWVL